MSLVHVEDGFAILDEQRYFQKVFETKKLKIRPELFEITGKFMPDSQFEAIQRRGPTIGKKRGRPRDDERSEDVAWIQKLATEVKTAGTECGYFKKTDKADNNKKAREAAGRVLEEFQHHQIPEFNNPELLEVPFPQRDSEDSEDVARPEGSWLKFSKAGEVGVVLSEKKTDVHFYIPPDAVFHSGDVRHIDAYSRSQGILFDLVIADPPWECRSVKRKKTYETSDDWHSDLHLANVTTDDVLVCIWITNRRGIERDLQKALETWHMRLLADWKWLKVTMEGEPVFDFDNPRHKIPFERLVFAVKNASKRDFGLPEKFCFASIPMAVHSHKPPILDILRHFGVRFERPLELFARNLLPGTVSVGFEPLLLQSEFVLTN